MISIKIYSNLIYPTVWALAPMQALKNWVRISRDFDLVFFVSYKLFIFLKEFL
jgi:hypothetical protein